MKSVGVEKGEMEAGDEAVVFLVLFRLVVLSFGGFQNLGESQSRKRERLGGAGKDSLALKVFRGEKTRRDGVTNQNSRQA